MKEEESVEEEEFLEGFVDGLWWRRMWKWIVWCGKEEEMEIFQADFLLWERSVASFHSDHLTLVLASSTFLA